MGLKILKMFENRMCWFGLSWYLPQPFWAKANLLHLELRFTKALGIAKRANGTGAPFFS